MNNTHINAICSYFDIGTSIQKPSRVYGGLLHIMWRLDTTKGSDALKQLSKKINLKDNQIIKNYELSEQITASFIQQGIPAVGAINVSGKYLSIIDNTGFLVYPWINSKVISPDCIKELHVVKIAKILSKIHALNLDIPELLLPTFDIHSNEKIIILISDVSSNNRELGELTSSLPLLLNINSNYLKAINLLKTQTVISHGDLDAKNVLWDKQGKLSIIDWESTRRLNPTYEIVNAALDCSNIGQNFNEELFIKMLKAYQDDRSKIDSLIFEAALHGICGNWINWLVYNMYCLSDINLKENSQLAISEIKKTISIIIYIYMKILINLKKH